ncbi:hypothetical protein D049_3360B, partial [Vibrio parahaemolyticus VPTS-2010]
IRLP